MRGEWPWSSGAKVPSFFAMSVGRDASTIKVPESASSLRETEKVPSFFAMSVGRDASTIKFSRVGFKSQRDGDGINVLPR